jgi:hypothetical protein
MSTSVLRKEHRNLRKGGSCYPNATTGNLPLLQGWITDFVPFSASLALPCPFHLLPPAALASILLLGTNLPHILCPDTKVVQAGNTKQARRCGIELSLAAMEVLPLFLQFYLHFL